MFGGVELVGFIEGDGGLGSGVLLGWCLVYVGKIYRAVAPFGLGVRMWFWRPGD